MSYDELTIIHSSYEIKYMLREIKKLLDIKDKEDINIKIDFVYYKNPFKNSNIDIEKEIIAFTKNGYIIQAKPIYSTNENADNFVEKIKISLENINNIEKINFITSNTNLDSDCSLELILKNSNTIKFDSTDINEQWKYDVTKHIKEIAQYLIK